MKKFYSLVLMAAALLIGTNAWAGQLRPASSAETFETAWKAAQNGDTIRLTNDVTIDKILWVGGGKSLTLDLYGNLLRNSARLKYMFVIEQGSLNVITTKAGKNQIIQDFGDAVNEELFHVTGSDGTTVDPKTAASGYYSHLTIGEGVFVIASKNAVVVSQPATYKNLNVESTAANKKDLAALGWATAGTTIPSQHPAYSGSTLTHSLANEVRVDIYGNLHGNKYAFKVNGNVKKPNDVSNSTFVQLHSTSDLNVPATGTASKQPVAAYCSGYARWLIEGHCIGANAVYVKAGDVEFKDAVIESNFSGDYVAPSATTSGVTGIGSAIVIESNKAYQGDISVEIGGTTSVAASNGYAIDEVVTNAPQSEVEVISITGGTFQGGDVRTADEKDQSKEQYIEEKQGTISISESTTNKEEAAITVTGGVYAGNIETLIAAADNKNQIIDQVVAQDGNIATVVIGEKEATDEMVVPEDEAEIAAFEFQNNMANDIVKLDAEDVDIAKLLPEGTTEVKYLSLTGKNAHTSTVTVETGKTLKVGQIVMDANGRIIVEAGATLIVTGENGIFASKNDNVVLQTSEAAPAILLFNPGVESNRHPNATVKMLAKQIGYMNVSGTNYWFWHRFALPIQEATSWTKIPNVSSYVYGWNYANDSWEQYTALTQMKPFCGTILTADQATLGDVEYTFTGELAGGNENAAIKFERNGFHYFGNSYTAHISLLKLVDQLVADEEIDGTVWVWGNDQNYHAVPLMALKNTSAFDAYKEIAPMHTFVLKHKVNGEGETELDYESAVWGNPRYNLVPAAAEAPARRASVDNASMRIIVTAENGKSDDVMFMEDGLCSDDYENGYDGVKYMNENALNMFASVNGENYSVVATDNLAGKVLTINTVKDVNYTMSFANVNGEEYAVRDNATGAIIAIVEGTSYEFAAQPNSVIEGRFEIIGRNDAPTAIENTNVKANAKGIYTLMGQYVGENFEVLPAGIYVVNGVKIVK